MDINFVYFEISCTFLQLKHFVFPAAFFQSLSVFSIFNKGAQLSLLTFFQKLLAPFWITSRFTSIVLLLFLRILKTVYSFKCIYNKTIFNWFTDQVNKKSKSLRSGALGSHEF